MKYVLFVSLVLPLCVFSQTPIVHLPFDGNTNDISGNSLHGVANNVTLTSDRFGVSNSAYQFNGVSSYVMVPYSSLYNFSPSGKFTISVWLQPFDANSISAIVVKSEYNSNFYLSLWNYGLYLVNNKGMSGWANNNFLVGTTVMSANACWHHLAVTYDNGKWVLYVDGIVEATDFSQTHFITQTTGSQIGIGRKGQSSGDYFWGKLDDIRVYDKALTFHEIKKLWAFAGEDSTICQGSSIQLSGIGGGIPLWAPGTGLSNANINNPVASPTVTTQYILQLTQGACILRDTVVVNVVPLSVNAGVSQTVCAGDSVSLSGSSGSGTYTWQPTTGMSYANTLTPKVKVVSNIDYIFTRTVGSCIGRDTVNLTVKNVTANAGSDKTICKGDSTFLLGSGSGTSYSWTPNSHILYAGLANAKVFPPTQTTYFLTVTDGACSAIDTVQVFVTQVNANIITPDTDICLGDSITLQTSPASGTFVWSPASGLNNTNTTNPKASPLTPTRYYFTVTDNLCSATDSILINPIQVWANAGPDRQICKRDIIQLNATGAGSQYSWLPIRNIMNNLSLVPTVNPDTTTTYYLTITGGSCVARDTVTVFVNPLDVNILTSDTGICQGDTVQLLATTNAALYGWTPTQQINNASLLQPKVFPILPAKYYLTVTDGTCTIKDSVLFTEINILADAGIDTLICRNDTIMLQANVTPGAGIVWSSTGGLSSATIANPMVWPQTTSPYFLNVTRGNCKAQDTVIVSVLDFPLVNAGLDVRYCFGLFDTLHGTVSGATDFIWKPATGISDVKILDPGVFGSGQRMYILEAVNQKCISRDTVWASENLQVLAAFKTDELIKLGLPAKFSFSNQSKNAWFYTWKFEETAAPVTLFEPEYTYSKIGKYTVWLFAMDSLGCKDSTSVLLTVEDEPYLKIPNVFTPNGDFVNDSFAVVFNEPAFEFLHYYIYNRWGELLYETHFPNGKFWDGRYKGEDCAGGVYFYLVDARSFSGRTYNLHGTVTLMR